VGIVLSVDLAAKRAKDLGLCVLEVNENLKIGARFPKPKEIGLAGQLDPQSTAERLAAFCIREKVSILMLDGPQGWKSPENPHKHCRCCEKALNTQAKTGIQGQVKPRNYAGFVRFSIEVFRLLVQQGCQLAESESISLPSSSVLLLESYPHAAWCMLGITPLPGKKKKPSETTRKERVIDIQRRCPLLIEETPNHDELQALVAGLAGLAIINGNPSGYSVFGKKPVHQDGQILEGFIVCPKVAATFDYLSPIK
jgi:hypothetical protein